MTRNELEKCISAYGKDIYSFCVKLTGSRQEADDLYQDTFLKATEQIGKMDAAKNLKSYLLSVAMRIWKNRKRKYAWRRRIFEEQYIPEVYKPTSMETAAGAEEEAQIRLVLETVLHFPEKMKTVLLLYYMEGLSVEEIAKLLHIPKGTVKSRLFQAREKLKKEMEV